MTEYRVVIPEERHALVTFEQEGLPGVAVINAALIDFEPRAVFGWHLSIVIDLEDLIDNGMPSTREREVVDPFGDALDSQLEADDRKPNALFLARVTWNATRELVYRIHDPDPAHRVLQERMASEAHPRKFSYVMENDEAWELASWHLEAAKPPHGPTRSPERSAILLRPTVQWTPRARSLRLQADSPGAP